MSDPALFFYLNKAELTAALGADLRLHIAGAVPQTPVTPYATYYLISDIEDGNLINDACSSRYSVQIDVWSNNPSESISISGIIKRLLKPHAFQTFRMNDYDVETKLFRESRRFDFMIKPN